MMTAKLDAVAAAALILFGLAAPLAANTWKLPDSNPPLAHFVAVDETGENGNPLEYPAWPNGDEDLAGNGLVFSGNEDKWDVRSVYAVQDPTEVWVRLYVSGNRDIGNMFYYVFVDADDNPQTGGGLAPDMAGVGCSALQGIEFYLVLRGSSSGGWQDLVVWDVDAETYAPPVNFPLSLTERSTAYDPIDNPLDPLYRTHSYAQARISYATVNGAWNLINGGGPIIGESSVARISVSSRANNADETTGRDCNGGGGFTQASSGILRRGTTLSSTELAGVFFIDPQWPAQNPTGVSLPWFGPDGQRGWGEGDDDACHASIPTPGTWTDPDTNIWNDPSRPLVFYEINANIDTLRASKFFDGVAWHVQLDW